MIKKCKIVSIFMFSVLVLSMFSCQKQQIEDVYSGNLFSSASLSQKMVTNSSGRQILSEWLSLHERNLKDKGKKILKEITSNLDYASLWIENRKNGENLIIIPINRSVSSQLNLLTSYLKLDEKSIFNLVIVQNRSGKLRWSSIISYLPEDGVDRSQVSEKTIQNIINGEHVVDNGMYKFIDLKGNLQYQVRYKNGKLYSFGKPVREDLTNAHKSKNTAARGGCLAWYLITTYYYADGSSSQTKEYLFTTCDEDSDEGGGGGGGTGGDIPQDPEEPEEPNDQEITVSGSFDAYETDVQPEDYQIPEEIDIPEQMDLDENGNPYPPVPFAPPVKYSHTWLYTYNAVGPFYIKAVYMNDATVHPGNIQYPTASGTVTRNIVLFDQHKTSSISGETANLLWTYYVNTRWTNTTTNVSKVIQRVKSYPKTIPF
jgi:hypothetical protein